MTALPDFDAALGGQLDLIDRMLASRGVELRSRPFRAAIIFVDECVIRVGEGDTQEEPGPFPQYADSQWFRIVYARTVAWYSDRYGPSMKESIERHLVGVTLVLETPFTVLIPKTTSELETPGETAWLCFHDRVEQDENSLGWVLNCPNLLMLPRSDGMRARRLTNEVASALRLIDVKLMTVEASDVRVSELRDQILPHLEQAASEIAKGRPQHLKAAQWHLQMACELVLKMLLQQGLGTFPESHDLFYLYDQLRPDALPFSRHSLARIPNWKRMAEWRYGGGPDVMLDEAFRRYRGALRIVSGAAANARREVDLSRAKFLLKRAPFLHNDPEMFKGGVNQGRNDDQ